MIGYFILGVSLLGALALMGKLLITADPKFLAKALRYTGFGLFAAVALFLLLTGRFALGPAPGLSWPPAFSAPLGPCPSWGRASAVGHGRPRGAARTWKPTICA